MKNPKAESRLITNVRTFLFCFLYDCPYSIDRACLIVKRTCCQLSFLNSRTTAAFLFRYSRLQKIDRPSPYLIVSPTKENFKNLIIEDSFIIFLPSKLLLLTKFFQTMNNSPWCQIPFLLIFQKINGSTPYFIVNTQSIFGDNA